jgi:shikimate dehydrogenase
MAEPFSLGLIGYPLDHSRSPRIHAAALDVIGRAGSYNLFPISPGSDELEKIFKLVRVGEIHGLNVTIPHKQNVMPFMDDLTPTAEAIGAVNTIYMEAGRLTGHNTDAGGFRKDLNGLLNEQSRANGERSALVLGAGGSARAVVYALLQDGWGVTIAARRIEQANKLAEELSTHTPHPALRTLLLSDLRPSTFNLLINTTPLGQSPNVDSSPWPSDLQFPENAAVYDLVYNPAETKLVRDARAAGLPAMTGFGMLINQALLSFEIWTGERVESRQVKKIYKVDK